MRPDFVVIGGMKCGTTSLWHYLRMHPQILMPQGIKNLYFYIEQDNWGKGIEWYESFFDAGDRDIKAAGEMSTEYTKFPAYPGVASRMASVIPEANLVYLVRHPVKRIISQYIHMVNTGKERRSINKALEDTRDNPYINYSRYALQLEQFLEFYPKERIFLMKSERLRSHPAESLRRLFGFIGVDAGFEPEEVVDMHKSSEKRRWNIIGRLIRKSPAMFNNYNYYLSRMPGTVRKMTERIVSKKIEKPQLDAATLSALVDILGSDLEKLAKIMGEDEKMWELQQL